MRCLLPINLLLPTLGLSALALAPTSAAPPRAVTDDLKDLVVELENLPLGDDPAPLVERIADLGTREAVEELAALEERLKSLPVRIEVVHALGRFDGIASAEQPALQKLMDVAVGKRVSDLREAALSTLGDCEHLGHTFLLMIIESAAADGVRKRALELHIEHAAAADEAWYQLIFRPKVRKRVDDKRASSKRERDANPPEPEWEYKATPDLRRLAFGAISTTIDAEALVSIFRSDPDGEIRVSALQALDALDYADLEDLAEDVLFNISVKAKERATAATILARLRGGDVVDDFIVLAKKQEVTPDHLRQAMAELLSTMGDDHADKQVAKLLGKGKPHQRTFALRATRRTEDRKVIKKILKELRAKDAGVWTVAVEVVGEKQLKEATEELEDQLEEAETEERTMALLRALTSIHGEDSEWLTRLAAYVDSDLRSARIAALRTFVLRGEEGDLDLLAGALTHPDWSTRLVALHGLEQLHVVAVVSPIVARMPEEVGRMQHEFADVLWRLTGKPFRTRASAWTAWWEAEGEGFELIEAGELESLRLADEGRRLEQETAVEFFGIQIQSHRVIFVVDVSGSMAERLSGRYVGESGQTRMAVAKKELRKAIEALDSRALFNIVPFHGGVTSWVETVAGASEHTREESFAFIDLLGPGGATNLYGGLRRAFKDTDVDTIVVLSDGEPSAGAVIEQTAIREAVQRWNEQRDIKIHTVALGGSLEILEWLAEDSGGKHVKYD